MSDIFKFKQFEVDQSGCAMKINTDGVLLGAFAEAEDPAHILDIGTGTGVIALMLAQKFALAKIDAVEVDLSAAKTAEHNFQNSSFRGRLAVYNSSFQDYFRDHPERKYDLIITNPPFYINSLESPGRQINLAKHADEAFFEELIACLSTQLTLQGNCWLILPIQTAQFVKTILIKPSLYLNKIITIRSFSNVDAHREILVCGLLQTDFATDDFVIYDEVKKYSQAYKNKLKDFFTIF
ncbi:methyltransferase [Mucilaginibacter sp. HMF5004]|uniref:tRNA1(Val) (adenine(37)-N6)-methyltransferase n=1 Tax=Mucilaginibacter rivuli TaxID=2857527 RepID=UPI001C5F99C2|nr:methyltransferase [Mucilaginibacter rivuli]MBW4890785.1 methyltransferase [Mucilaginibacter rivuli]